MKDHPSVPVRYMFAQTMESCALQFVAGSCSYHIVAFSNRLQKHLVALLFQYSLSEVFHSFAGGDELGQFWVVQTVIDSLSDCGDLHLVFSWVWGDDGLHKTKMPKTILAGIHKIWVLGTPFRCWLLQLDIRKQRGLINALEAVDVNHNRREAIRVPAMSFNIGGGTHSWGAVRVSLCLVIIGGNKFAFLTLQRFFISRLEVLLQTADRAHIEYNRWGRLRLTLLIAFDRLNVWCAFQEFGCLSWGLVRCRLQLEFRGLQVVDVFAAFEILDTNYCVHLSFMIF